MFGSVVFLACVMGFASMLVMSFFYNWLDARAASWNRQAALYETDIGPKSNSITKSTFVMNDRRYRGVATIGASRRGLYLALDRSRQFLHPALLIPWSEIEAMPAQPDGRCALRVKATASELRLEGAVVGAIRSFLPGDDPRSRPLAA
jgi:hypothetical protein